MSSQDEEEKVSDHMAQVEVTQEDEEANDVPLMVAMQPTADVQEVQIGDSSMIEVQEVVVVTDVEGGGGTLDLKTAVDISSGNLVPVGAVEEIEEIAVASGRIGRLGDIKEPVGPSRRRPSVSTSEGSATDESESDAIEYAVRAREPKKREFAHRLQWRSRDMVDAMKAVEDKKMTIRGAAKKFNVPYSTLKDRIHGRVRHGTKPGVKTILSPEEEEELVRYIRDMEAAGFQMRHVDVRDRAGELLRLNHGHNTPYKEGSPGHNWLGGFLKRHPGLEFRRTLQRNMIPSAAKQKQMLKKFYEIAGQIFKKHRLHHKSDRIFVVSEFRIRMTQHATVLVAASADGTVIPPFVVFHGQKLKLSSARQAYPEAFFTCSFNGFINDDIFLWWFRDHFLKKIPATGNRPLVLFLSRSVTDISLQLAQRAKEERVFLVAIPPQVTHLVSPLDEELANDVETMMTKKANKWHEENENYPFTQRIFAELLRKVWKKSITAEEVTRKFGQNGLFPLSNTAITADRILSATQMMREAQQKATTAVSVKQDPLAGLSLLSALSSHEYASLGHMYASNENLNRSFDAEDGEVERVEVDTPVAAARSSPRRPKRRLDPAELDVIQPPVKVKLQMEEGSDTEEPAASTSRFKMSEELVKHVLEQGQGGTRRARSASKSQSSHPLDRGADVQNEIVAARENIEQINRAIDSILEKAAQDEALKKRNKQGLTPPRSEQVRAVDVRSMRADADAADNLMHSVKREEGEVEYDETVVSEEIVPQELVQEDLVQEEVVGTEEHIIESDHSNIKATGTVELDAAAVPIEEPVVEEMVPMEQEVQVHQDTPPEPPPQPEIHSDLKSLSVNQLVQSKRTILVETVMVNGQKVKIVRMAPAEPVAARTITIPSPGSAIPSRGRGRGRGRGRPRSTSNPKITIVKASPRRQVIMQPPEPVALHDMVSQEEVHFQEQQQQEVVMDGEVVEHPSGIITLQQQQVVEEQVVHQQPLYINALSHQQVLHQQPQEAGEALEVDQHGVVTHHAIVTEDGIIHTQDGVLGVGDGGEVEVPVTTQEQSSMQDLGETIQVVVSQPHLVTQEGVPAQIFEQEEQQQQEEPQPQVIQLQGEGLPATGEDGQPIILQQVEEGGEPSGEQHVIQQDENGVQYVQVYNPSTGQHEQVILQQQVL